MMPIGLAVVNLRPTWDSPDQVPSSFTCLAVHQAVLGSELRDRRPHRVYVGVARTTICGKPSLPLEISTFSLDQRWVKGAYLWSDVAESGMNLARSCRREPTSTVFLGTYEHTLDDKGRVSLPSRFRDLLAAGGDARLVVTTNVDPNACCLVAYSVPEWQAFHEKIAGLPQFEPSVIRLRRLFVAGASECPVDRQGRILIPPFHREYAALKDTVLFAGLGTTIEIWDRGAWEAERSDAKQNLSDINGALAQFGL